MSNNFASDDEKKYEFVHSKVSVWGGFDSDDNECNPGHILQQIRSSFYDEIKLAGKKIEVMTAPVGVYQGLEIQAKTRSFYLRLNSEQFKNMSKDAVAIGKQLATEFLNFEKSSDLIMLYTIDHYRGIDINATDDFGNACPEPYTSFKIRIGFNISDQ